MPPLPPMHLSNLLNHNNFKLPTHVFSPTFDVPPFPVLSPSSERSSFANEPLTPPEFSPLLDLPLPPLPSSNPLPAQRAAPKAPARTTRRSIQLQQQQDSRSSSPLTSLDDSDEEDLNLSDDGGYMGGLYESEESVHSDDSDQEDLGRKRGSSSRNAPPSKRVRKQEIWSEDMDPEVGSSTGNFKSRSGRTTNAQGPPRQSTSRLDSSHSNKVREYILQEGNCLVRVGGALVQEIGYPVCHLCISRMAANMASCPFKGFRWIECDDQFRAIPGVATFTPINVDDIPYFPHPLSFNQRFDREQALKVKIAASRGLLPTLQLELQHAQRPDIMKVKLDLVTRATCDGCNTSIFCASFFCGDCGREYCLECKQEALAIVSRGKVGTDPLRCGRDKNQGQRAHTDASLRPFTRYDAAELDRVVQAMSKVVEENPVVEPLAIPQEKLDEYYGDVAGFERLSLDESLPILYVPLADIDPLLAARPLPNSDPTLTPPPVDAATLLAADQLFESLMARGEPIITAIDPKRWSMHYTPEKFIEEHGNDSCLILSNVTQNAKPAQVMTFFSEFGIAREIGQSKKIKDWPSSDDFKIAFRTKFDHYMDEVPRASITRRDGVLNLASHAPPMSNPPDLGPKGYFSQISDDQPGGSGSTKLHSTFDVADAVNIMPFACDVDGKPGYAVWDMWRRQDTNKLREFLYTVMAEERSAATGKDITSEMIRLIRDDPIHSEKHYMDVARRARLLQEYGVKSWRIVQSPGQAVFIPAGCAHQVCNFADCIKIASDFVSTTNVPSCAQVTKEFRSLKMEGRPWKSDVLQLKTLLFWAWRSAERFDEIPNPPAIESHVTIDG